MIHVASSAAYKTLLSSSLLSLPSVSTVKVSKHPDAKNELDNTSYLHLRISELNKYDRTVILIIYEIDEIYMAKRVEYSGGDVPGLTTDGLVA